MRDLKTYRGLKSSPCFTGTARPGVPTRAPGGLSKKPFSFSIINPQSYSIGLLQYARSSISRVNLSFKLYSIVKKRKFEILLVFT
jgi:hypothetical protein